jgi:GNAT superfamily N-acetyltransferase
VRRWWPSSPGTRSRRSGTTSTRRVCWSSWSPISAEGAGSTADGHALEVDESPDLADLALLEERVSEAAIAAADVGEDRAFAIFVRDDERRIVAGISGMTWGECCELHAMWVDAPLRGRGLGRALLAGAESVARRRGCTLVQFFAYDLLAQGLYERLGYQTVGVIEGCPAGAARWYRKDL